MEVYINAGLRTPLGHFLGGLSTISAPKLAGKVINQLLQTFPEINETVTDVILGHVIQAGVGQAPARQATLFGGLKESVKATTVNKVCGSGLMAVIMGVRMIKLGESDCILAGGMENMSQAPHFFPQGRQGVKFGKIELLDSMQNDGLLDVYSQKLMGSCAEECVKKYGFNREDLDNWAIKSFKRAIESTANHDFQSEIVPVEVKTKKSTIVIREDEGPKQVNFEKIPKLRPAFIDTGAITAANSSTISDGAAILTLTNHKHPGEISFRVCSYAGHAQNPTWFTTAPIEAINQSCQKANLSIQDIGLFEINEAFSVVTLAAIKELKISEDKVNIFGGAVALGHPLGCSGARILVTLMNGMKKQNIRYGLAALCIGGGEALSIIVEKVD